MRFNLLAISFLMPFMVLAQTMTPELLWSLGRASALGISLDGKSLVYKVTKPNVQENSFDSETFKLDLTSGVSVKVNDTKGLLADNKMNANGTKKLMDQKVKIQKISADAKYVDLKKSDAMIYDDLMIRHWDTFNTGAFNHVFIQNLNANGDSVGTKDIMDSQPYDCPTMPFGGAEDYIWSNDGSHVIYVCKKKSGAEYANSTNTDLYSYALESGETENLTKDNLGYDTSPQYSKSGVLAYLSMKRDGFESDKNDIKVLRDGKAMNLTASWDGTVNEFIWSSDYKTIYFTAPVKGTVQLFSIAAAAAKGANPKQITNGQWDIAGLVGQSGDKIISGLTDMNHAKEYYSIEIKSGKTEQLTHVNDAEYAKIKLSNVEPKMIATSDGKEMLAWVIYPPEFDPAKKYPTLLYTQGGPQSALSQFYSFRWNFQLMAAQGYIVVAPNRRGMPGYGVEWNEDISKDWGGQSMADYLAGIDAMAKEPYVDNERLGCVGASYGGYSAFFLAGTHEGRFKTIIAHDGVFNLESMYGSTEELFFVNWDLGGPYWEKDNEAAQKSYKDFNPINYVGNWDTPIMIYQGGKDYRVADGQAFEAFTAARQLGLKSRLVYFPEENHWILTPQNGLVWQREFFNWLKETL